MEKHQTIHFVLRDLGIYWAISTSNTDEALVRQILDDHGYDLSRSTREEDFLKPKTSLLLYETFGRLVKAEIPEREMQSQGRTIRQGPFLEKLVYTFGKRFSTNQFDPKDEAFGLRAVCLRGFENALSTDEVVEVFLNIDEPTPVPVAEMITRKLEQDRLRSEQRLQK
ncbi:MAG: hypothetical protein IPP17_30315 [Bacteroidetes bacterium]|nr:hypothetical protein [Bacteroidota bacterium]